jgi:hypothetical protein
MIGVFCALDLVLFYLFFEAGLIQRHQEGGEQDERHREAVDAELEPDRLGQPGVVLDKLGCCRSSAPPSSSPSAATRPRCGATPAGRR